MKMLPNKLLKAKISKFSHLLKLALVVISWLARNFEESSNLPCSIFCFYPLVNKLQKVCDRGDLFLLSYIKQLRTALLLFLSGEFPNKIVDGCPITKDGIPKALGPIIPYIRSKSPGVIRLTLTILYCTRGASLGGPLDTSTITTPSSGLSYKREYIKEFWETLGYTKLGYRFTGSVKFKNYHWTTKTGPSQDHALYSSMNDFYNLDDTDKYHLKIIGGSKMISVITFLSTNLDILKEYFPWKSKVSRRITHFPDKEDKVRVVAIGDYFSQTALRPLHIYLNKVLRKLPADCTFNQSNFIKYTKNWTEFYSIDLTAFTDRFPIILVYDILSIRFGKEYADSWRYLMVEKPFMLDRVNSIRYEVGTPMGMYSSWPSTTLAHHFVVFCCCRELDIPFNEAKYVMLGDDIVIGDRLLAEAYTKAITELGVTFSPLKTHSSDTLFEFSKRLFLDGKEITPFPISSLRSSIKRYYRMVNLLIDCEERGWTSKSGISEAVKELSKDYYIHEKDFSKLRKRFLSYIQESSFISEVIMKMIRARITADQAFALLWYKTRLTPPSIRSDYMAVYDCHGVFTSIAVEAFEESSRNYLSDKHLPLGAYAESLVASLTSEDIPLTEWPIFMNLEYIPILYAHGHISELYTNIHKEAYRIDTVGQGEWPLFLRTISLPLDDRVYFERNNNFTSQAAATLGKKITERICIFSGVHHESSIAKSMINGDISILNMQEAEDLLRPTYSQ
jgi:hypothetical protein